MAASGLHRRAIVDLDAFAANLAEIDPPFLDARANAFGHDISLIGPVARDLGVGGILVSDDADAGVARSVGFTDVRVGRLPAAPGVDSSAFGTSGAGRPVLSLVGEVIAVKHVAAGAGVSYGYTHRTSDATTLALIGLGYADGVPRLASNRAEVLVAGSRRPLVGRIAMDQLVVDCGDTEPELGAPAVLFGDPSRDEPTASEWGVWTERAPLALIAGLGDRIVRERR